MQGTCEEQVSTGACGCEPPPPRRCSDARAASPHDGTAASLSRRDYFSRQCYGHEPLEDSLGKTLDEATVINKQHVLLLERVRPPQAACRPYGWRTNAAP